MSKTIKILVAVLIIMLPVGLFLMLSGDAWKQFLWTTNIFLLLQAVITLIFLLSAAETKSVSITSAIILILAFTVEYVGVTSGYPFGKYSYTNTLSPAVFGVPVAITLSWFSVSVNSFLLAKFMLFESKNTYIILVSALIILGADLLLEPFASSVNGYWLWEAGKIPLQNYVSWFIAGLLFSFILNRLVIWNRTIFENINFITIPAILISVNILQFTVVNLVSGYIFATLIGLILISSCILLSVKSGEKDEE
jgi:uncharacterized membrane protein